MLGVTVDARAVTNLKLAADLTPLYRVWDPLVRADVQAGFARRGSDAGPWEPNRPLTVRIKGHSRQLEHRGPLRSGMRTAIGADGLVHGPADATLDYAYIQQFGGEAGPRPPKRAVLRTHRGDTVVVRRRVTIPARPYNQLSAAGTEAVIAATQAYISRK